MRHHLLQGLRALLGGVSPSGGGEHLGILNRAALHRVLYIRDLFRRIEDLPGAVVECGVGQGRGLAALTSLVLLEKTNRKV
jgi:hypothetical protein